MALSNYVVREIVEDIRRYRLVRGGKIYFVEEHGVEVQKQRLSFVEEEVYDLLVEKQVLESKYRHCILDVYATLFFTTILMISHFTWMNRVGSIYTLLFLITVLVMMPRTMRMNGKYSAYFVFDCPRYRSRLKSIVDKLLDKTESLQKIVL